MFGSSSPGYSSEQVIGLDVGGKVFYFTLSKLTQSSSTYFAKQLGSKHLEGNVAYVDDRGRKVIFIDRSPTFFEHVRDFIVSNKIRLPVNDSSESSKALRQNVRDEAAFFGMDDLVAALKVSQQFSPDKANRGLLYWLGTDRGTKEEYENPFQMGSINVTGWMDDADNEEEDMYDLARFARSRETFVHYQLRPEVAAAASKRGSTSDWDIEQFSCLQWCGHAHKRMPVVLDLKTVEFQPTHYSLRVSECKGMAGDWNFEGSNDGKEWDVLHQARDDDNLWLEEGSDEIKTQLTKTLAFYNDHVQEDELSSEILLTILEQDYRHTWVLDPPPTKFYRYFRLIGASKQLKKKKKKSKKDGKEEEDDESDSDDEDESGCLHGEGLELFGNLYEP